MTSDELDRELHDALNIEPPAGYAARIRARVAVEQLGAAGHNAWWPVGLVAAGVAVLIAGGLFVRRDDFPGSVRVATSRSTGVMPDEAITPARPDERGRPPAVERRDAGGVRRFARGAAHPDPALQSADSEPAVLISADDAAGLRLLMTMTEPAAPPPTDERERPTRLLIGRIDVMPIELDSLPQPALITLGELQ